MKKKRNIIIVIISIILVFAAMGLIFMWLNDDNKLTVAERKWMDDNVNKVQNINVVNNANVFGKNGSGVFYDFLNDFSLDYSMDLNPITFNSADIPQGISLGYKNEVTANDIIFYTDHYVLISKKDELIKDYADLKGKVVGIHNTNLDHVKKYLNGVVELKGYTDDAALFTSEAPEVEYYIVPLMQYLDLILKDNYNILYHFSDIENYYIMQTGDDVLSAVLKKYYNTWKSGINEYYNDHEFEVFTENLKISEMDIDKLKSVVHNYGFVNTSPYEVIMGGKYGGIVSVYLSNFADFADIELDRKSVV